MSEEENEQRSGEHNASGVAGDSLAAHPLRKEVHHAVSWLVLAGAAVLVFVLVYFYTTRSTTEIDRPAPTPTNNEAVGPAVYTEEELEEIMSKKTETSSTTAVYTIEELGTIMANSEGTTTDDVPKAVYTQEELDVIMKR